MVKKSILGLIAILICLLVVPPAFVNSMSNEPKQVLLLYDSLAKGTVREGNIEAIQRLLASFGVKVTVSSLDSYKQGTLKSYPNVIAVRNAFDLPELNPAYIQDFEVYKGEYLHIGAFIPINVQNELDLKIKTVNHETISLSIGQFSQAAINVENVPFMLQTSGKSYGNVTSSSGELRGYYGSLKSRFAYATYWTPGNLTEIAMANLLHDWLGIIGTSKIYLLIKEISPVSDLKRLEKMADLLYESGIPFLISVRPVFDNLDYPAIQRYLKTLKYVQSRNGSILINAPTVSSTASLVPQSLKTQLAASLNELLKYGVVPLGIGAELFWTYDSQYAEEGMTFFNSVVLFPNKQPIYRNQSNTSLSFSSSLYSLGMDELNTFHQEGKELKPFPTNTAITYDFFESEESLNAAIHKLKNSWIAFNDYKSEVHSVHTNEHQFASSNGYLTIDGHTVDLINIDQEVPSKHVYVQENKKSLSALFSLQNNIFIVLILLTLAIFGFFLAIGYRLYKRKYINMRREL